jgi:hypothetical protein
MPSAPITTQQTVEEAVAALERTNASLQRATWRLKGVTRTFRDCVKRAENNHEGLRQVVDDLKQLYPPERPKLELVKGGDDA